MSQSLSRLWTHLIFSTKHRFPFLKEPKLKSDMHAYLAKVLRSHDCETLIVGGTSDHLHALFDLSRKYSIATIVKEIKRTSSAWIKEVSPSCNKFHWQNGYGAFSVSQSHLDRVYRYIERQEQHHRRVTFQNEFRAFLKKYGIEYDERYVWD
jgi:REP element-mobilizing transposase RayT